MWKQFISDYLTFTKRERTGTLLLLAVITILIILPFLFPFFIKKKTYRHDAFEKEIASLTIKQVDTASKYKRKNYLQTTYHNKFNANRCLLYYKSAFIL